MKRTQTWLSSWLVVFSLFVSACGTSTPTTGSEATSAPAAAATSAPMATSEAMPMATSEAMPMATTEAAPTSGTANTGAAASTNPADYGLKADKPFSGTKIKFLVCCSNVGQFAAIIKRTQAEFTPMTGIEVEWDNTPWASFQEKMLTEATTGSGTYDMVAWVDSWGAGIKPYLVPLDDKIAQDKIDLTDYPKAYVDVGSQDGKVYGLPLRGHAQVLFYRKDVFSQLNLQPPTTWAEVASDAKVIREKTQLNPIPMYFGVGAGQSLFMWLSMMWGKGGDIFGSDQRPIFNNEAGVDATSQYVDFVKNNLTDPSALTFNEGTATEEMTKGRAAMFVGWSWIYENFTNPEIAAPELKGNIGVVPAPSNGAEPVSYAYVWPTGILQSSKNQDAAWEYIKWMTNAKVEKEILLDKSDPKTTSIVSVHLSNLNDPEVNATTNGLHKIMGTMLTTARTEPLIAEWPEIQTTLETSLNEMAGGADVKGTLDKAQQEVDAIMKRGGYYQ